MLTADNYPYSGGGGLTPGGFGGISGLQGDVGRNHQAGTYKGRDDLRFTPSLPSRAPDSETRRPRKPAPVADPWKEIVDRCRTQWTTHGQQAILQAEYNRGMTTGKSWCEIDAAVGQIVKGWNRGAPART